MSEEQLKPCPFCGGDSGIVNHEEDGMAFYVSCSKCQVASALVYSIGEPAEPVLIEKWNRRTNTIERDTAKKIRLKLQIAKDAKKKHKSSNQCEEKTMGRCTACHFWSGTISAYSELIGESGVID